MFLCKWCKFVAPLALFSINTLKEITSIERLCLFSVFFILMGDVYILGCLGNAALKADCFSPCY